VAGIETTSRPSADYNLKIIGPLGLYVRDCHGPESLARVCAAGGVRPEMLDGRSRWVTTAQFEAMLEAARAEVGSDALFKRACVYRLGEAYGAMRFVLGALTPMAVLRQSLRTQRLVTSVGTHEIVEATATRLRVRWYASPPYTRLTCLLRQAQAAALPTLWGLPPAVITERSCLAHGDPCCDFDTQTFQTATWWPSLVVFGGAALTLAALAPWVEVARSTVVLAPSLLAAVARVLVVQRTTRDNQEVQRAMADALESVAHEESEARKELLALHERQREWTRLLEQQDRARREVIQQLGEDLRAQEARRTAVFRGYSHDLRNPMQVIMAGASFLRDHVPATDDEATAILDEMEWAVGRTNSLLVDLNRTVAQGFTEGARAAQTLPVAALAERARRRVRALAYGKDITTTVTCGEDAPTAIELEPIVLDRILDNLLTNAVKYTDRGAITVAFGGAPEHLVVRVGDTGRGFAPDELRRCFTPEGSSEARRASHSLGVGLSVVVRLLADIRGRLEVRSQPSAGTTFWVYLPVRYRRGLSDASPPAARVDDVVILRDAG
jgi:signal transduction histidine kinase